MKDFITKNFIYLIIIALAIVIMIQRCRDSGSKFDNTPKVDTIVQVNMIYVHDTVKTTPIIIKSLPPNKQDIPPVMIPDGTYTDLKRKYDSLLLVHYTKNIQIDSTKISTFGYVKTQDTVYDNKIIGRQWTNNLQIPEKTTTITITKTEPPKTHIYLGLSLSGTQSSLINGAGTGFLIQNKRNQLYGVDVKLMSKIGTVYEARTYWDLDKLFRGK